MGVKAAVDSYLDTEDKRLYQAGWACRLRNVEGKQLITLKSTTPVQDQLHRRREVETELETSPAQAEGLPSWPDSPVKKLVVEIAGSAPLQTLFTLYQTRHQFHVLKHRTPLIELSLDEVSLNDPKRISYRELEAELLEAGVEANLVLLVKELQAQWPLQVETRSKFERALAEITAKSALEYPIRDQIGLEPSDSLAEAGRKVLSFYFGQMLSHEPDVRFSSDIEAVHDMRVATRRMRAAFRLFKAGLRRKTTKSLRHGLRAAGRSLGRLRDLDVLLENLQHYQISLRENERSRLQPLLEMWLARREEARRELLIYLNSKKYRRFKQEMLKFVTSPGQKTKTHPDNNPPDRLRYLVPGLIYKHYEAVRVYEGVLDGASLETLHQLRIAFKHFRYALEYFAEILGEENQRVIEEVKALQDHLGELNDAHVAAERLGELVADWRKKQADDSGAAAYLQARIEERQHLLDTFPSVWTRFNRPDLHRDLALAISVL